MPAVFVYGTFLPGEPRWPLLEPYAAEVVDATVSGRLYDTGRGYPAARFDTGPGSIPGVCVRVWAEHWNAVIDLLDGVEAEGTLYRRMEVVTSAGAATTYEWLGDTGCLHPLPDGWRAR